MSIVEPADQWDTLYKNLDERPGSPGVTSGVPIAQWLEHLADVTKFIDCTISLSFALSPGCQATSISFYNLQSRSILVRGSTLPIGVQNNDSIKLDLKMRAMESVNTTITNQLETKLTTQARGQTVNASDNKGDWFKRLILVA